MSDIDVDGDRNRVAGRDFIEVHLAPEHEPLSQEQRKRLNLLVNNISSEYKVDPWTLWREVVHTRIGVSKVRQIPKSKFSEAERALLEHAEHLHSLSHAKRLVAEVLQIANERGLYQDLTRYCSREFDLTVLNKLNPEQLKQALRFVEDAAGLSSQQNNQLPADRSLEGQAHERHGSGWKAFVIEARAMVVAYPIQCGLLAALLVVLGKAI
ncbi:TPA: hypothetical protein ACGJXX_004006 [Pseudomonas aeruginosa]|uniref:hypothetical protein n=1 Tax=Pseudomonas aeruginosa TaxID=287 RepID=UPI00053D9A21|nr:hypothetical protein [Pseudomonas aeruginosa]